MVRQQAGIQARNDTLIPPSQELVNIFLVVLVAGNFKIVDNEIVEGYEVETIVGFGPTGSVG
jgi:hypothetical protein